MFLLTLAVAPVAFLLMYIYKRDVIAKEPPKQLAKAFGGGVLSAIVAVILELFILEGIVRLDLPGNVLPAFAIALFNAAIPEELCKFLFLWIFVWHSKDFDEFFDGIVYAVFVSMGFACIENILYVFQNGSGVALLRAFTAVPAHFFFAVIMGYYFSLAKFEPSARRSHMIKGISGAIVAHAIYDFILLYIFSIYLNLESDYAPYIIIVWVLVFLAFVFKLWKHGFKRINQLREIDILLANNPQQMQVLGHVSSAPLEPGQQYQQPDDIDRM